MGAYRQESVEFKLGQSGNLDDSRNEKVEMEVFEMLQPHENIKEVLVKDYGGTRFPSWIGSPLFFNMLVLEISNCTKCQILSPLGQLSSLKDLTVEGIKSVGEEFYRDMSSSNLPFPSLETLKFENMSQWEVWYEAIKCCFRHLQNIEICYFPKLRRFSHRFPSLKRMFINGCQQFEAHPRILTLDSLKQSR
ncbi:hypothetical protein Dsin_000567 [Dipteronia sinensis]|uniref:R13L1/DRL21-like LRR repeat region domain-containing protein n=1 Tax=Dipteronia sinensis TaxID=43782 RepID=A0AAE0B255_9ROSI|nr:hypothetical protein Dsin_000567 [Dipteronia sinensis]